LDSNDNDAQINALAHQAHGLGQQGQREASLSLWREVLARSPEHALSLNFLGQDALMRGNWQAAKDLLARATKSDPTFALAHANLARTQRLLGEPANALASLAAALKLEPQAFPAHLEKALIHEELGQTRSAALSYENVLRLLPSQRTLPSNVQAQVLHAQRVVAENKSQLCAFLDSKLSEVRPLHDSRGMRRFDESLEIAIGKKPFYQPHPLMFPITGLPNIAFFDREDFSWAAAVEAATHSVVEELDQVLSDDGGGFVPYVQTGEGQPAGQFAALDKKLDWGAYFLWRHGRPVADHMKRCPNTMAALALAPQVEILNRAPGAFFSSLKPNTHIPQHTGATNCRLTVHLPLIIPDNCALRVGNHLRSWTPGELLIFDDTIEHEAWNRSSELRVVLIFDIWHPHLNETECVMVKSALEGLMEYYGEQAFVDRL